MTTFSSRSPVWACVALVCLIYTTTPARGADEWPMRVGIAVADITPPQGFPMAGYYHERLADGTLDPLLAKAVVFRSDDAQAALVVCDLIGIATDLSREVRRRAAQKTGIPAEHIVVAGTHTHTAPDYMKELYLHLADAPQESTRKDYIQRLITSLVDVIAKAHAEAKLTQLASGSVQQKTPVSFNRRFVMRDGSVRTWMSFEDPLVVRSAGPIDPEIGLIALRDETGRSRGVLSNFALHLDTVGGTKWSADYPNHVQRTLQASFGPDVVSTFGTGCCGDINHVDPRSKDRNKADAIGNALGQSIASQLTQLTAIDRPTLAVRSRVVQLPLQEVSKEEVAHALQLVAAVNRQEKVEFLDHVAAYKKLLLAQLRHPQTDVSQHMTWGLSRSLAGIGDKLPVDVTVIALGQDVAIVCLPGEVFVELGLAIKQGSPFRTTLVVELANQVETIYIPNRAAYAGGSYEVTNSATQPGSGEMLVEAALSLLRQAASSTGR